MRELEVKKGLCMITCPVGDFEKDVLECATKLGAEKTILVDENKSFIELLNKCGLITDVAPIFRGNINSVTNSTLKLISKAKNEHDEVCVVLLPSDPVTTIGMYIAACMENVKVHTAISDFETDYLPFPFLPSVNNINETEMFILTKIIENGEVSKKELLEITKKEKKMDVLSSRSSSKEESLLKNLQRALNKLEKTGFVSKRKSGRHFVWKTTPFGKLIFNQKEML